MNRKERERNSRTTREMEMRYQDVRTLSKGNNHGILESNKMAKIPGKGESPQAS